MPKTTHHARLAALITYHVAKQLIAETSPSVILSGAAGEVEKSLKESIFVLRFLRFTHFVRFGRNDAVGGDSFGCFGTVIIQP